MQDVFSRALQKTVRKGKLLASAIQKEEKKICNITKIAIFILTFDKKSCFIKSEPTSIFGIKLQKEEVQMKGWDGF